MGPLIIKMEVKFSMQNELNNTKIMTTIQDITDYLEQLAPLSSQENYDNCGLIVGDASTQVTQILVTLDCTEEVIEEAIQKGCNLIVAHHPIVFKGLKKLNGKNYVERAVIKAIKNDVAIYAIHTNLDNALSGVNQEISKRLGLINTRILQPKADILNKLIVYVPTSHAEIVKDALFKAGAGSIGNYDECSFSTVGTGTFRPLEGSHPQIGNRDERSAVEEVKLEIIVTDHQISSVLKAMRESHIYEEVAYDLIPLRNTLQDEGAGMIGELENPMDEKTFLAHIKKTFQCGCIRHTPLLNKTIKTVAVCGGSGSFLIQDAIRQNADIYITADVKYHEFFDADKQIIIADIGHYESEQYTSNLIIDYLKEKFTNFAILKADLNTNPINYF